VQLRNGSGDTVETIHFKYPFDKGRLPLIIEDCNIGWNRINYGRDAEADGTAPQPEDEAGVNERLHDAAPGDGGIGTLRFFHELLLEFDAADAGDFAVDIVSVVAFDEADVLDFGSGFDAAGTAFDLEVFDYGDRIAVAEDIAVGVFDHQPLLFGLRRVSAPLVSAFGTDQQRAVFIGVFASAFRAVGEIFHGEFLSGMSVYVMRNYSQSKLRGVMIAACASRNRIIRKSTGKVFELSVRTPPI